MSDLRQPPQPEVFFLYFEVAELFVRNSATVLLMRAPGRR
jgi:hypothetical protein